MKKTLRIIVSLAICAGLILGYYYYLSHRDGNIDATEQKEQTEVEKVLSKDFTNNYPRTPREVLKWYNRILTALYNEEYTDEELEEMGDQLRCLLDDELLEYNPRDTYITNLRTNVSDYQLREKTIVQTSISDSNDVTYATVNGDFCAYVNSYYFAKEASNYSRTYEEFVLRRDNNNCWKILTYRLTEGDEE